MSIQPILVLNGGSSSLKWGLYGEEPGGNRLLFEGVAAGIGQKEGQGLTHSERDSAKNQIGWRLELKVVYAGGYFFRST